MPDLNFKNLSLPKLIALGDAFIHMRDWETGAAVYQVALKHASGDDRAALQVRRGLAVQRDERLTDLLSVLQTAEKLSAIQPFVTDGLATWLKICPFLEDERFMAIAEKHEDLLPVRNWHWNLQTALWAARRAKPVAGDFVELGVFRGHTTAFLAEYLEFQTWPKRWWLYDTFEGIPEDQLDAGWDVRNAGAYKGKFGFEEVRDRFAPYPNIDVIQGRVPEILEDRAPEAIAFLHVDLNNSAAEIAALDLLFDRVSPGGVILFDDYGWSTARAQHDAEDAWFRARDEQILALPTGQGLFIKR